MDVHMSNPPPPVGFGVEPHQPYSALAPLYDRIMSHVDYTHWAAYILSLIERFAPEPQQILELGCGTGSLSVLLHRRLNAAYLATDNASDMLAVARRKLGQGRSDLRFENLDFRNIEIDGAFDVVLLAYDGINYLLESEQVATLIEQISALLNPAGIFLFDQSTPANSINNLAYFDDAWDTPQASYSRSSQYDAGRRLHVTRFDIRAGQERMTEIHYQRAYELQEMELTVKLSSLRVEGCYDAFTDMPATGESERIQWVLSKPHPTD